MSKAIVADPPKTHLKLNRSVARSATVAALLLLMSLMFSGVLLSRFSPDESQWIYTARYLTLFRRGDFESPEWDSYWTDTQPPLARYMMGTSLRLAGFELLHLNGPWDFTKEADANRELGNMPTPEMLFWARLPMGLIAAGAVLLLYCIALRIGGRLAGLGSAAWLAINPRSRELMTRAEADGLLVTTILLSLYLVLVLLENGEVQHTITNSRTRRVLLVLLLGVVLGLGMATKLTGTLSLLAVIVVLFTSALVHALRPHTPGNETQRQLLATGLARAGATTLLLALISAGVFVALNPALYGNPVAKALALFSFRQTEMQQQMADYPSAALPEGLPRIQSTAVRTLFTYSVSAGLTRAAFGDRALEVGETIPVDLLLVAMGLFIAARRLYREGRTYSVIQITRGSLSTMTALIYLVIFFFGISLNMGLDWDRYTLPIWVFAALWAGVGIGGICDFAAHLISTRHSITLRDFG